MTNYRKINNIRDVDWEMGDIFMEVGGVMEPFSTKAHTVSETLILLKEGKLFKPASEPWFESIPDAPKGILCRDNAYGRITVVVGYCEEEGIIEEESGFISPKEIFTPLTEEEALELVWRKK